MKGVIRAGIAIASAALAPVLLAVPASAPTRTSYPSGPVAGTPDTRDAAVRMQLQSDETVVKEMLFTTVVRGVFLCALDVLGTSPDGASLYVWLQCQDYRTGPRPKSLSGSSLPALVRVAGVGADTRVTGVEFPRQATLREDMARLFPAGIVARMNTHDFVLEPSEEELLREVSLHTAST